MTEGYREAPRSVFDARFLAVLEERDDVSSAAEAEWAGDWKVFSIERDRHLVLRAWQDPLRGDAPLGSFLDRSVALLCAAVLPLEARPSLFLVTRPTAERDEYAVLVRDTYGAAPGAGDEPVGQVKELSDHQLLALHLAGCLARSPHSLALLLEAAGPTALRLAGEILHRRLMAGSGF